MQVCVFVGHLLSVLYVIVNSFAFHTAVNLTLSMSSAVNVAVAPTAISEPASFSPRHWPGLHTYSFLSAVHLSSKLYPVFVIQRDWGMPFIEGWLQSIVGSINENIRPILFFPLGILLSSSVFEPSLYCTSNSIREQFLDPTFSVLFMSFSILYP